MSEKPKTLKDLKAELNRLVSREQSDSRPKKLKELCLNRNSGKRVTPAMMEEELNKLP